MSESDWDMELQELEERSVGRLAAAEFFDESAFNALYAHVAAKAEAIKEEHVVSKQVLSCLVKAERHIRSTAEYVPQVRDHLAEADRFWMLLELIIAGEAPSDRTPGVPRII